MWVRSQKKGYLLKVTGVYAVQCSDDTGRLVALPEPQDYPLGDFPTYEAALAELDAIERHFEKYPNDIYQVSQP